MQIRKPRVEMVTLKWSIFIILLASVSAWAIRGVLVRAQQMKAADTSASALESIAPGSPAKAVVRLDRIDGSELKGTLLQRQSDTVYLLPSERTSIVTAILTPDTSVVMGKPEEIVPGAIVQLDGTMDEHHSIRTNQVVILTGYVRLSQGTR
jgi:hypothetical protein